MEPTSLKLQNRFVSFLAAGFVTLAFVAIFAFGFLREEVFSEVLAFAGTLIGSITGYYFGERGEAKRRLTESDGAQDDAAAPASPLPAAG